MSRLATTAPAGPGASFDRRLIAPMILGAILNPVNSSIVAVALVPIGIAFGAPAAQTAWLVSGLYLATAVGQPVVGRLVDLYGPRRLYLAGTALVGAGGLLGALSPSLAVLVVSRVLLGLGTCAGYPAAMSLIRSEADRTGQESPATILTILAVSTQTTVVIGPTLGGFLLGLGGWRAAFLVNVPLALVGLVVGARRLPRGPRVSGVAPQTLGVRDATPSPAGPSPAGHEPSTAWRSIATRIDLAGIALFTTTIVTLLLFLTHPRAGTWYLPVIAGVALAGLVAQELRAATPFLDVRVLAGNGPLLATYGRALLMATVSYSLLYGFTQWLEEGRGVTPAQAGLLLLPVFATAIGVSALTGRNPRIRAKLVVGGVAQVAFSVALLFFGPHVAIWLIVALALVAGVPQGLLNLANQNAVYAQADPARVASSAGLLRTFFYLGAITSSTATGFAFTPRADSAGLHELAVVMIVAAAGCLLLAVADRSLARVTIDAA